MDELDRLLDGTDSITLDLSDGASVTLTWQELMSPQAFRRSMEAQTGYRCQFTDDEFGDLIRALLVLSCEQVMMPAA